MTRPEFPRRIYDGRVVQLTIEQVQLPDGRRFDMEVVHHSGGAAVVAVDDAGQVCLLRQYRHAAGGWLWELPAGKLEPDEEALATARRELQEEAGVTASQWVPMGRIHSSPGVFTETIELFLARDLSSAPEQHGDHELIEIHWLSLSEALAWACDGTITDAKTLVGLLRVGLCHVLAPGC